MSEHEFLDDYTDLGEKPPRPIDFNVCIKLLFTGCITQFSFLLLLGASIIFWIIGTSTEIIHGIFPNENWVKTDGYIIKQSEVGKLNRHTIYRYDFNYNVGNELLTGKSHTIFMEKWYGGETVSIFYDLNNVSRAKISGMNTEALSYTVGLCIVILPIVIALFFLMYGVLFNILFIILLRYGIFTLGKSYKEKEPANNSNRTFYIFEFEFEEKKYSTKTFCEINKLSDSGKILFLEKYPTLNKPLVDLVSSQIMDEYGDIRNPKENDLAVLIFPFITIALNLIGYLLW